MQTTISIAGTDYDGSASGWAAQGISNMEFSWDLEAYWSFSFSVFRKCNAYPPYPPGVAIAVDIANDDGSGRHHIFVGDLQRPEGGKGETGYVWNYTATDLKRRADYVTLTGLDGSGIASFNLQPDDPLALYATSGQTVGAIVAAILQQLTNATLLSEAGVGAYTTLTPPTLPAVTLADLANLTVVPPEPVQLRGSSILNVLEQFVLHWHPQYCLYVLPDGTIRVRSIFALTPVAVALPSSDGTGDHVDWPEIVGPDITDCFTAWQISGLDIQSVTLSTVKGTLAPAWANYQQAAWTIRDFLQPKGASDDGALSSVTSSSCTVSSDYPAAHWPLNFWNGPTVGGWIWFDDLSASGIDIYETRQITSCTALTPGGAATITWDLSLPINRTSYTRYRIVGRSAPLALVGCEFLVREPATGALGRDTYVGSHMYPRDSRGMPVANNSRAFEVFMPYAFLQWSRNGAYPYFEVPVNVQENPLKGSIVLTEPAVLKSAGLAASLSVLSQRYPANFAEGLYYNLQVVIPYNRGDLAARAPSSGYSGTAFTKYGLQRTFTQKLDTFNWIGDQPALATLAAEHLACVRDAVVSGSINYYELPTNFDVFTPGFCLNVAASGGTTPLDGLDLPVRSATVRWHEDPDPVLYSASLRFNNRKRPYEGDDLYIHPALGRNSFGTQDGEVFGESMMGMARDVADSMPSSRLSGATPVGETPMGQAPAGQAPAGMAPMGESGPNPIANDLSGANRAEAPEADVSGLVEGGRPGQPDRAARREAKPKFVGPPTPPGFQPLADPAHPDSIMNTSSKSDRPIDPDAGSTPRRPGGLAERRGETGDDTQDGGG